MNSTSADIKRYIRDALDSLESVPYNASGDRALPIRPDVYDEIVFNLCDAYNGPLNFACVDMPKVVMDAVGRVEIVFSTGRRRLRLLVPCDDVVVVTYEYPGDDTRIEETLRASDPAIEETLLGLRSWLLEGVQ